MAGTVCEAFAGSKRRRFHPTAGAGCDVPVLHPILWTTSSVVTTTKRGLLAVHWPPLRMSYPSSVRLMFSTLRMTTPACAWLDAALVFDSRSPCWRESAVAVVEAPVESIQVAATVFVPAGS